MPNKKKCQIIRYHITSNKYWPNITPPYYDDVIEELILLKGFVVTQIDYDVWAYSDWESTDKIVFFTCHPGSNSEKSKS